MKIFGWMHKKLHLGTEYHRFALNKNNNNIPDAGDNGTMSAAREKEGDPESLLLTHVLLTIGTFGHSNPPLPQTQLEQEPSSPDHHDGTKFEEENIPPTMIFNPPTIDMQIVDVTDQKPKQLDVVIEEEIVCMEPLLKEEPAKVEKRMTLAELFAAEPVAGVAPSDIMTLSTIASSKKIFRETKKFSKEEKGEDSRRANNATKKIIHRLIRSMVKKRIHPDHVVTRAEHVALCGKRGDQEGLPSTRPQGRTNHRSVHLIC